MYCFKSMECFSISIYKNDFFKHLFPKKFLLFKIIFLPLQSILGSLSVLAKFFSVSCHIINMLGFP